MAMLLRQTVHRRRNPHLAVRQNPSRANPNSVGHPLLSEKTARTAALGVGCSLLSEDSKIPQRCSSPRLTGVQLSRKTVKRSRLLLRHLVTQIRVLTDQSARRASSHHSEANHRLEASRSLSSLRLEAVVLFDRRVKTPYLEELLRLHLSLEVVVSQLPKGKRLYKRQSLYSEKASILRARLHLKQLNMNPTHQA